jgi:uncharacterized OsmC-like protein
MDKIVVQQDREFRVAVMVQDEEDNELHEVAHIHELSPYTMMLVSLGLCTGVVLHTYAQHHNIDLELAEMTVTYHRDEHDGHSSDKGNDEWIEESLRLEGILSTKEIERLERVAHHCSIRKMLESGIEVRSD